MEGEQTLNTVLNVEPYQYSHKAIALWKEKGYKYVASSWAEIQKGTYFEKVSILIVRLGHYVDATALKNLPNLKYLISATTGHDHIDLEVLKERSIDLISLRGSDKFLKTIPSTAEHSWALLMALIRKIPDANQHVKLGKWDRDLFRGYQLKDKTIGIIGLGRTGLKMASYATVFDMNIQYYDPNVSLKPFYKCGELKELLESSDIITIHVHLNEETKHMLNEVAIKHIKNKAFLINTSRGKIWDESQIVKAIYDNTIAGIATDVLSTEIDDIKKSPLWNAQQKGKNIIITPHIGGATYDAMWACEEFIIGKL